MKPLPYYIERVRSEPRPARFLVAELLRRSRLSQRLVIDRGLFRLRFFPTNISAAYWVDPARRGRDERFFRCYLRAGDTVVDVGANVGALALTAAALVGDAGRVFAFEPHPTTYRYLNENVALNGFTRVHTFNLALGCTNGSVALTDFRADDLNHVISGSGLAVEARRLDDVLPADLATIALLKVDVEGFEKFVFEGACRTLGKTECVYFEAYADYLRAYGYTLRDLAELFAGSGFALYRLSDERDNLVALRDQRGFIERTGKPDWLVPIDV